MFPNHYPTISYLFFTPPQIPDTMICVLWVFDASLADMGLVIALGHMVMRDYITV